MRTIYIANKGVTGSHNFFRRVKKVVEASMGELSFNKKKSQD